MTVTRTFAASMVLFSAACAGRPQPGVPAPARGDDGPPASIDVVYSGGIISRQVTATFQVREPAFVVVGHLGGDGMLRVLYPSQPNQFAVTPSTRRYRTTPFFAGYDGAPSLHSFALSPYRSLGAQFDSYDGRGYGYVFIIASRTPMRFGAFNDGFDWFDLDVRDYFRTSDPRVAVEEFARTLTRGAYTLRFAKSYTTMNLSGYAATAWDCAVLSSISQRFLNGFWDSWGAYGLGRHLSGNNIYPYSNSYTHGCGPRHYASYAYVGEFGNSFTRRNPVYTPRIPVPPTPITATLTRPTVRGYGERAGDLTRSELTRSAGGARNARASYESVRVREEYRGASVARRDVDRARNYDPPSVSSGGGARAASERTASASASSGASAPASSTQPSGGTASDARAATAKVKP